MSSLAANLLKGAVAGAAATLIMDRVTSFLYEREAEEAVEREQVVREGRMAFGVAAEKAARLAGRQLSDQERQRYGSAVHWLLGIGSGALYGALRHRIPGDLARGLLFGTAYWAVVDEGGNSALGFTPPPREFPWQAHARGLVGHVAYGASADAALRALDRVA